MLQCCRSTKPFVFKEFIQSTANLLRNVYIALHWEDAGKCTLFLLLFHSLFHLNFLLGKNLLGSPWMINKWEISTRYKPQTHLKGAVIAWETGRAKKYISASHNCYCENRSFLLGKLLSKYFYVLHDCLILREIHFGFTSLNKPFLSYKYSTFWVDPGSRMVTCIWKIWLEQVEPIH